MEGNDDDDGDDAPVYDDTTVPGDWACAGQVSAPAESALERPV